MRAASLSSRKTGREIFEFRGTEGRCAEDYLELGYLEWGKTEGGSATLYLTTDKIARLSCVMRCEWACF
jgi:hypothetical protein